MEHKRSYYLVNAITLYWALAAPLLLVFIFTGNELFKWFLAFSFFTDSIDGYLARKYKVASVAGSKLDSIADDLTIVVAVTGAFVLKPEFMNGQLALLISLFALFFSQVVMALVRYGKVSSFHTYLAKAAALLQGSFLILLFFLEEPPALLFYIAAVVTALDLAEEMILVLLLPRWQADVKGLYWVLKGKKK